MQSGRVLCHSWLLLKQWPLCIRHDVQSGDREIADDLLRFFVDEGQRECFAACLYTCYDLVKPDVAMEVAWTNGLMDAVMPFLIQMLK